MAAKTISSPRLIAWLLTAGSLLVLVPLCAVSANDDVQTTNDDSQTADHHSQTANQLSQTANLHSQTMQPVVLELFTSQGCSSCPPADALLREFGQRENIIALSFHVDYWNRLGWEDPYSDREWSVRQEQYVKALGGDTLYTPQIVVNGANHVVGSDEQKLAELISRHRNNAPIAQLGIKATKERRGATVRIEASHLSRDVRARPLDLQIFITENGIETSVRSGENARRKLQHDHVVRRGRRVQNWDGSPADFRLKLDEDWDVERLELVVLVQDAETRQVVAAARQTWP